MTLPILPYEGGRRGRRSSTDQDLAVVWELMRHTATGGMVQEHSNSDIKWTLSPHTMYSWLEIDFENLKPVDKYIHPVKFNTGLHEKI